MENKPIARTLRLLSQLMELHDENPFKILIKRLVFIILVSMINGAYGAMGVRRNIFRGAQQVRG